MQHRMKSDVNNSRTIANLEDHVADAVTERWSERVVRVGWRWTLEHDRSLLDAQKLLDLLPLQRYKTTDRNI